MNLDCRPKRCPAKQNIAAMETYQELVVESLIQSNHLKLHDSLVSPLIPGEEEPIPRCEYCSRPLAAGSE
jgi:hypothetical protein